MQRDLNVFKRLVASLPTKLMEPMLQEAKGIRLENAAKHFCLRANVKCKMFGKSLFTTTLHFDLFAKITLRISINNNNFSAIYACYDDGIAIIDYCGMSNSCRYDWNDEQLFAEIKRICDFDVRNPHYKPSARFLNLVNEITYDYIDGNIYYKRQRAYELLAIHKFRKDSIIAMLPIDVLKIIINKIF